MQVYKNQQMNNEQRLAADVNAIVTRLRVLGPIAIVLHGAYGRGEGSWVAGADGGSRPYNDYDLLLLLNKKIPPDTLNRYQRQLADALAIRWVDIGQKTKQALRRLRPSIYNYDLKYASKVIYGDSKVLELIPHIRPEALPLREAETLFLTRLWTLLGSLDEDGLSVSRDGDDSMFFRNQMAKAVLAVVDVLLLQKSSYHWSYKERIRTAIRLYPDLSDLHDKFKWALEEKLHPKSVPMSTSSVVKLYAEVHHLFFKHMTGALSQLYNRKITSVAEFEQAYRSSLHTTIKRIGYWLLKRTLRFERVLRINIAQAYIAAAYGQAACKTHDLQYGVELMRSVDPSVPMNLSWDEARVRVAKLRMVV